MWVSSLPAAPARCASTTACAVVSLTRTRSPLQLLDAINLMERQDVRAGQQLYKQGEPGDVAYVVMDGCVDLMEAQEGGAAEHVKVGPRGSPAGCIVAAMATLVVVPVVACRVAAGRCASRSTCHCCALKTAPLSVTVIAPTCQPGH
jgi:hypothetical protein